MTIRRVAALVWLAFGPAVAHAQSSSALTLPSRLGADARASIQRIADSARAVGLPVAPLADKAAEGVLKGADDARIVGAVRALARELGDARGVLGGSPDAALLTAMASALHAGAPATDLQRIARSSSGDPADARVLALGLITLVDLVAKQVPPAVATSAIGELVKRRAPDDQFAGLRLDVEQDIRDGVAPEASLAKRVRARVDLLDALPANARGVRRPPL